MAKVNLVAVQPYKGRAAGDAFTTSLKNSRALIDSGTAKLATVKAGPRKVAAKKATKKAAAKKAPAKKAAAKGYNTRALKAR